MKKFFSFVSGAKSLVAALLLGAGVLAAWADATLNSLEVKIGGKNVVTVLSLIHIYSHADDRRHRNLLHRLSSLYA